MDQILSNPITTNILLIIICLYLYNISHSTQDHKEIIAELEGLRNDLHDFKINDKLDVIKDNVELIENNTSRIDDNINFIEKKISDRL